MDEQAEKSTPPIKQVETLEVKDAQVIFTNVWNELEAEFGHENLRFSKELILLGGAPGSGKADPASAGRRRDSSPPPDSHTPPR